VSALKIEGFQPDTGVPVTVERQPQGKWTCTDADVEVLIRAHEGREEWLTVTGPVLTLDLTDDSHLLYAAMLVMGEGITWDTDADLPEVPALPYGAVG
jgi:hypothetical protein